ncbi:MAG: hypothetical protein U0166_16855 [Acidobacteriota bacterium]
MAPRNALEASPPTDGVRAPAPPATLVLSVALVAGAMLLVELALTRLFSVMFYYHYSFFAVSLVMSGLAFGGLLGTVLGREPRSFAQRRGLLAFLAMLFALGVALGLAALALRPPIAGAEASVGRVVVLALLFLPGLTMAGAFLALAFAQDERWIGRLYAADMLAAASASVGAIAVMRTLQGPGTLLAPILFASLAVVLLRPRRRLLHAAGALVACAAIGGIALHLGSGGRLFRLRTSPEPAYERWNEFSRIAVLGGVPDRGSSIVIDSTASTPIPTVPARAPGAPIAPGPRWDLGIHHLAYRLGRPLSRVAVIGVGGGRDLLAGLAHGAHVDGYELNPIEVDILLRRFPGLNRAAAWPEVSIVNSEARVGIAHAGKRYDLIQASLIDTWAATAAGGFVLSENGLYTVEGWETFLRALSERGLLTMTRWYLRDAPAEEQKLTALAAAALERIGIADTRSHVMLAVTGPHVEHGLTTIIVSRSPFSPEEVATLEVQCRGMRLEIHAAPGRPSADATIDDLLAPDRRGTAIAASPYDISPPVDARPYFFLQARPRSILSAAGRRSGFILDVTFRAVRVMVTLVALAWLFAIAILVLSRPAPPVAQPVGDKLPPSEASARRTHRLMSLYFLGCGIGYISVQLAFHQRLILVLGSPTLALSVVLAAMLLGTGVGAFASGWLSGPRIGWAFTAIVAALAGLVASFPALRGLESVASPALRGSFAGLLVGAFGILLGLPFPLGVRLVAPLGPRAIPRMWAINGAASIAGSTTAALAGLLYGSRVVAAIGLGSYVLVAICGAVARPSRVRS